MDLGEDAFTRSRLKKSSQLPRSSFLFVPKSMFEGKRKMKDLPEREVVLNIDKNDEENAVTTVIQC